MLMSCSWMSMSMWMMSVDDLFCWLLLKNSAENCCVTHPLLFWDLGAHFWCNHVVAPLLLGSIPQSEVGVDVDTHDHDVNEDVVVETFLRVDHVAPYDGHDVANLR